MIVSYSCYGIKGELLLKRGAELTSSNISALKNRRVMALCVKTNYMSDEEMFEAKDILNEYVRIETLNLVQEWIEHNESKKFIRIEENVKEIINEILNGKTPVYGLAEICTVDSYTYAHSVDVCILAVMIGCQMDYGKHELKELAMGSLLHDIGKTRIDNELLNKPDKLNDDEMSKIKKHTELGYEMLKTKAEISPKACEIALNHHERYDGSGYPSGLKGDQIQHYAVICAIADTYNAMVTDRVYRRAVHPSEAYEMILGSGDRLYPLWAVRAFLKRVTPYPVGTLCHLSNGYIAQVIALEPSLPLRPEVEMLQTKDRIKLRDELSVTIKGCLTVEEVQEIAMTDGRVAMAV